jgi:hypothetical protein
VLLGDCENLGKIGFADRSWTIMNRYAIFERRERLIIDAPNI